MLGPGRAKLIKQEWVLIFVIPMKTRPPAGFACGRLREALECGSPVPLTKSPVDVFVAGLDRGNVAKISFLPDFLSHEK